MKAKMTSQFVNGILVGIFLMIVFLSGAVSQKIWGLPLLKNLSGNVKTSEVFNQKVVNEESVVTDVAEHVSPAVVTISYNKKTPVMQQYFLDPFGMFGGQRATGETTSEQVDIGSGFIVDKSGLVVTNKHVVSSGTQADYKVILKDDSEHQVEKIWRDPVNDLAILKISGEEFDATEMGDSDNLKVGNFVVAIGTALGEFRHTVTTGVISGLGRGIIAGDGFTGSEKLDNVIQTDAAINPGNSGGPLLNSSGQVIGVNVAVSQSANSIGFALPINVVKASLQNFNETGQFDRPFFGVRYQMIDKEQGILNKVPSGAYIVEVVKDSSADKAGLMKGDIITKFDGKDMVDSEVGLVELLSKKKIGDKVEVEYYREKETKKVSVELKGE
ncbi:MAG: trypsin-like peptidase domain-containing protein [bacterium]